ADAHDVRRPQLLPLCWRAELQQPVRDPAAGFRVESRGHLGGHRPNLARAGGPRREARRPQRPPVVRSHRHPTDYAHAARALVEVLQGSVLPQSHSATSITLAEVYKQINAPFGALGRDALAVSTVAIKSGTAADDSQYADLITRIATWTTTRNQLVTQI